MLSRREERLLRSLRLRKHREAEGLFVAEGVRAVEDLLLHSPLEVRFAAASSSLGDTPRGQSLAEAIHKRGIDLREVGDAALRELAGTGTPQGILAVAEIPPGGLGRIRVSGRTVVLVLDAVQDPGNFGTLARTAEALGAAGVVALTGTVDPWNPKCVRAAMGSTFRLPVAEAGWEEAGAWLAEHGFRTLASAAGGDPVPRPAPARAALVVGNEGAGISGETRARADLVVGIPLRGRAESLNVAAAGAILLYELLR
ncbi:MAG TPA: RNA methyltransferase [Longimicrobium sp.]|uniref:TrmH family RNA methyltransferase n=1 Tax=Longimicrobium sp. TaxID=2029185 RepID=UPI002ED7A838